MMTYFVDEMVIDSATVLSITNECGSFSSSLLDEPQTQTP